MQDEGLLGGVYALPGPVLPPQSRGVGEGVEGKRGLKLGALAGAVVEDEGVAIADEDEGDVQGQGIVEGLLHPGANGVIVVLGLDQRERDAVVIENVVGAWPCHGSPVGRAR